MDENPPGARDGPRPGHRAGPGAGRKQGDASPCPGGGHPAAAHHEPVLLHRYRAGPAPSDTTAPAGCTPRAAVIAPAAAYGQPCVTAGRNMIRAGLPGVLTQAPPLAGGPQDRTSI